MYEPSRGARNEGGAAIYTSMCKIPLNKMQNINMSNVADN